MLYTKQYIVTIIVLHNFLSFKHAKRIKETSGYMCDKWRKKVNMQLYCSLSLPTWLSLSTFYVFVSFSRGFTLLSGVTSFQPEELPSVLLFWHLSYQWILSVFIFWECLYFTFWKIVLLDIGFQVDRVFFFFPFNTLNMSSHYLLATIVSNEKSAVNLMAVSLINHFFLSAFKIVSLSLSFIMSALR